MAIFEWFIETYSDTMQLDEIRNKLGMYELEFSSRLLTANDAKRLKAG